MNIIRQHVATVLTEKEQYHREVLMEQAEVMLKLEDNEATKRRLRNIIVELGTEKHSNEELSQELALLANDNYKVTL